MVLAFAGYSSSPPSRAKPLRVPEISAGWGQYYRGRPWAASLVSDTRYCVPTEQLLICFGSQRAVCAIITSFFLWRRAHSGGTWLNK